MSHTPTVVEITEEEEEKPVPTKMSEINPTQKALKKLTKQKTKYDRRINSAQSEEDKLKYEQLVAEINDMRFILKLNNTNKNLINKILYFIEYPETIQEIQDKIIGKIEEGEI